MEQYDKTNYDQIFTKPIIRYGRLTNLIAIPLCFIPAIVLWIVYGSVPSAQEILTGWGLIASIYGIFAFVEPISYFPVVGLPGTYMVCLSGNIGNVRIPASAMAQESIGTVAGTKKAELVSTLGIAGSIITNMAVVTIAAVGGAALMSVFPPVVVDAFNFVSPAIFGAIFAMYARKNMTYGVFALVLSLFMIVVLKLPTYFLIPIAVFGTVAFAFFLEAKKK